MPCARCPSGDELSALFVGKVPLERSEWLTVDVDRGAECQAVVQTRDEPEVTLAGALCRAEPNDPYMGEPECRSAVARAGDQQCELVRDYRLLERLGEGGMGAVFKALHMRLGKIVALKILRSDRLSDPQNVARFEREMKAVGRLEHPRIVRALDAGNHDGTHYLVMEYVEGYDLAKLSRRMGPLDMSDACELARQAAEGLDQVHRNALVHRDIKPSNLMLTPDGQVKLLDLGLALLNGEQPQGAELTGVGQVMGTPDYLAPEQVESGHKVDTRADIYALGCTLYELLTGAAPFGGRAYDTPLKKAIAHVNETAPPLREKRAAVQSGLAALLERMLAKDPAVRPATPADVVAMLEPWSQGSDLRRLWSQAAGRSSEPHARTLTHTPSLAAAAMTETDAKLEPSASIEPAADGHRVGLLAGVFGPLLRLVRTRIRISVKIRVVVVSAAVLLMASLAYWGPSTIKSQKQVAMVDAFSDESRQSVKDARQTESVVAQFKRRPEASPDVERHFTASRHDLPKLSIAPAPVPSEFVKTVPELQTRRADRLSELLERTEPPDWRCARDEYEVPLQQAIATNDSARELELLAFHAECEMEVVENEIGRDWATSMVPRNFATRLLSKETAERLDGLEASEAGLPYRDYVVARLLQHGAGGATLAEAADRMVAAYQHGDSPIVRTPYRRRRAAELLVDAADYKTQLLEPGDTRLAELAPPIPTEVALDVSDWLDLPSNWLGEEPDLLDDARLRQFRVNRAVALSYRTVRAPSHDCEEIRKLCKTLLADGADADSPQIRLIEARALGAEMSPEAPAN